MSEIDPKLSRLYREAATEGPPSAVDAAILAAARKRVAQPERRARASWLSWMAPASAIATLVLGVSIAFLVDREQPEPTRDTKIRPIAKQAQSAPPASAGESAPAKTAASAAPAAAKTEAPAAAVPAQVPVLATPAAPAAQAFPAESREKAAESKLSVPKAASEANVARDAAVGAMEAARRRPLPQAGSRRCGNRRHRVPRKPGWMKSAASSARAATRRRRNSWPNSARPIRRIQCRRACAASALQPVREIALEFLQVGAARVHHVAGIVVVVRDALEHFGRQVELRQRIVRGAIRRA